MYTLIDSTGMRYFGKASSLIKWYQRFSPELPDNERVKVYHGWWLEGIPDEDCLRFFGEFVFLKAYCNR